MELGYFPKVITAGRNINDSVHDLIAREVVQFLIEQDKILRQTRVLVMGTTFKENVTDIRNSKVPELIRELREFKVNVDAIDPYADAKEFENEYGIPLISEPKAPYDAIILAVNHKSYLGWDESKFRDLTIPNALFYDVKGVYRDKIRQMNYLSL
jgi:UDP-N-acetyl-D-galactosamine dehydrogenase